MLALEKIVASFLTLPGVFLSVWIIITAYLIKKGRSIFMKFLALLTVIIMFITFTGLGVRVFVFPLENYVKYQSGGYKQRLPVVVLGGGIHHEVGPGKGELSSASLERLVTGYKLYRDLGTAIVYTGGIGVGHEKLSEAEIAFNWLRQMGVSERDIILESRARTTYENGVYTKKWLEETDYNKIYLVTSAVHMKRSASVFEKLGIDFIPVSAAHLYSHRLVWLDYLPNRGALNANMSAIHEWLGIVWYKIKGRI